MRQERGGGSPGFLVTGGDSGCKGQGFESQDCILDRYFSHLFAVKIVMLVWKDEKLAEDGPFLKKKKKEMCYVICSVSNQIYPLPRLNNDQFLFLLNGPTMGIFFIFILFKLQDSNSDRRSRRQAHWPLDLHHGQSSVLLCSKINYWLNQTSKKIDRSPGNINFYARNKKEFFSAQLQKQMALMCHVDDEEEDDGDGYEDGGRRRLKLTW